MVSAIIHVHIIYSPLKTNKFRFKSTIIIILFCILFLCSLQFFGSLLFNNTILYNFFGKFQYGSIVEAGRLTSFGLPRVQAFYLEPSYLAFVTITLICINLLNEHKIKLTFLVGGAIIFMSGSRGGSIGYFLTLLWHLYFSSRNKKIQYRIRYNVLLSSLIVLFILFSSSLVLISSMESLSMENTSQYFRFFSGFQLSNYILQNYLFGIPLGTIEESFLVFFGLTNTIYSFFFLNIVYHGWISFLLLLLIIFSIRSLKILNKFKILLSIYLLLYFNMTGSLLAPDTYFWFFCFYYAFRLTTINDKSLNTTQ